MSTSQERGTSLKHDTCISIYILQRIAPELLEMVCGYISETMGYQRKHYLKKGTLHECYMKGTIAKCFKKKMVQHQLVVQLFYQNLGIQASKILSKFPCSSLTFMCFANNFRTLQSPLNAVIDLAIKKWKKETQASGLGLRPHRREAKLTGISQYA